MVFESIVTDVLNKVLGDYVENLDHKQLKIGIWGGDVVLTNLRIRSNALDELDLPVQLVYGYIGKLVMKIPWKNLYSQPVIADIEHIYALVSPNNNVQFTAEKEEKLAFAAKKAALDALEAARKKEAEAGTEGTTPGAPGFTEKLTAQIINNLQIKISSLHVRYEDSSTTGRPFAFGITLSDLELFTTDESWQKSYMTERSATVFKIANLSCLSCYFNCHGNLYMGSDDTAKLMESFKTNIACSDYKPEDFYYVLGPISCNAKLKLHMNPENDSPAYVDPKIDLDLEMANLNVGMTNTQFTTLLQLGDAMNRMQLGRPYRQYRPFNIPYKGHAKEWWRFAITSVMVDVKRRSKEWSWAHMKEHRERCNKYTESYRERELSKKPTASLLETCDLLEHELDAFSLLLIRQRVNIEIAKLRETATEEKKAGWFSGWWGGGKKKEDENKGTIARFEAAMTPDEKAKMFKAIGYEESSVIQNEPKEYVAMYMKFKLISMDVGLYQDTKEDEVVSDFHSLPPILQLSFSMTTALVTQRPSAGAISVTAGMKELKCTGISHDNYTPLLVKSIVPDDRNLLDIFFETNPLDKSCDQRVKVVARPLQIVYDAQTVISLLDIFKTPTDVNLSNLEQSATAKLDDFKERSATGMQHLIDQKPILEIDVLLMPNILVVPRGGFYDNEDKSMIVISLGQARLISIPRLNDEERLKKDLQEDAKTILQNVIFNSYDRYIVELNDIQALVALPHENWQEVLNLAKPTDMHVLRPISFKVTIATCFFDNDPRMPKLKIDIHIPTIQFNITEDRVFEALNIATTMPLPKNDAPPQPPVLQRSSSSISNFLNRENKKRNEKAKTKMALADDEVVQYTFMEVNFSLNEVYLVLNQTSKKADPDDIDIESPFLTPEDHPVAQSPKAILPKSPELLQSDNVGTTQHILSFQVLKLEAQMAQRSFETVAVLKLGSINLKQFDTKNRPETETKIVNILDTPRVKENDQENYLLTILYKQADKHAPDFVTKYQSTEQAINVNFEVLDIVLHQEFLLDLLGLLSGFQHRLDNQVPAMSQRDRMGTADVDPVRTKLATIMEETTSTAAPAAGSTRAAQRQNKRVESIKMRLLANLKQLSLKLTSENRPLALMNVQKFVTDMTLKESYTEVNIGLKNIQIEDLNPDTVHSQILSMVGQDVFNCQVVMFNKEFAQNSNSDDMRVTVDIGCMKVVYLNWFVAGVMSFLNNFQAAQKAVSDAGVAAAQTARMSAIEAYEKATRLKLNVRIKAPIILIPVDSNSMDALSLDLGMLELSNQISSIPVQGHTTDKVIVDEIKLQLKDMKITKVVILGDGNQQLSSENMHYMDVVDSEVGIRYSTNIMKPISFTMTVVRNLSNVWYKAMPETNLSGRLKSIELTLRMPDYALVMAILNKNLTEGVDEFPPLEVDEPVHTQAPVATARGGEQYPVDSNRWTTEHLMVTVTSGQIYDKMKFNFQFDGVVINLLEAEDQGLARFGIYYLSVKGSQLNNGTMNTSIVLCNIQLDDTRPNLNSKIRQYVSCKDWQKNVDVCFTEHKYMVDMTAIMNASETFVELHIRSFDLIVCLDFLLKLSMFITLPEDQSPKVQRRSVQGIDPTRATTVTTVSHANPSSEPIGQSRKKMNIVLHLDEPDIILVESLNDPNTNCIVFNTQANLNYRGINDKQIINGEINALKMYMCAFAPERRHATRHYILHPATISLQGSTPEEEGLHVSLKLSDIIINISPATIELLNKAMNSISTGSAEKAALDRDETDYSDIWYAKPFRPRHFWFTRAEKGVDAVKLEYEGVSMSHKTEKCVIEVPNITVVLESGVGYYTKPLISLDTRMTAVFNDWSRHLTANGSLTLNMNYYNAVLAEWEPIIELNEVRARKCGEYTPWELKFDISIEDVPTDYDDSLVSKKTNINIHSKETLEITVSKTCLGLLTELGAAFSEAIDKRGLLKPEICAPYFVENDTGVDITLNLRVGAFTLDDVHRLNRQPSVNKSIVFQSEIAKGEDSDDTADIITCTISAGGRAYLKLKSGSQLDEDDMYDYNLYVKVSDIPVEVVLPVTKSDIRYFPLGSSKSTASWAIVSQVSMEYGATKINIHGMVAIYNHFTTRISVYRRDQNNMEIFVGHAEAGKIFNLPLHCIYAEPKEIYFSLSGYKTSVQGVSWNINPSDLQLTQQVQLDPIDTFEALYIDAKRHKAEIYFENTDKIRLSSCMYTLHLRPPLYLRNNLPIDIRVSVAGCSVRKQSSVTEIATPEPKAKLTDTIIYEREEFLDYGEMELNPGHVLHLPTVRMFSKGTESKSVIVVRLLNYVEKDWSYATEISKDRAELVVWTFSSYDSEVKMEMDIYVQTSSRYGSVMLTLYSPFWMINKTGQMLTYRTESSSMDVLYHPPEYTGPILYTVRDKFFEKKKTSIRVDSGAWSDKIPLDVAGSLGSVTCSANGMKYQIGVHNHFTHNSLTKMITFIPFYILCNKCQYTIELQEQERPADPWTALESQQIKPLWPKNDSTHKLIVRVDGKITPPFDFTEVTCTLLKLEESPYGGVTVDVQTTEGGIYITFTEYIPNEAPGLIVNHTPFPIKYYEKNSKNEHTLLSRHTNLYAWEDPAGPKMLVFGVDEQKTDLKRDQIGTVMLEDDKKAYWVSFLDGMQRVLLFTEVEAIAKRTESSAALQVITQSIELHIHGIGLSVVNNETGLDLLYLGIKSSGIVWESKKASKKRFKEMTIHDSELLEAEYQRYLVDKAVNDVKVYKLENKYVVNFDTMKLMKYVDRKIKRSFYPAIWVKKQSSPFQNQLHVKINRIQVDNQFMDPIFPVVLAPVPPPKSIASSTTMKPFIECSMVQRVIPNSLVTQYKYASILIQEFFFKVDIMFLTGVSALFSHYVSDEEAAKLFRTDVESIEYTLAAHFEQHSKQEQKNFYDNLHLGPLKIHVSFSMAGADTTALPGFLNTLVQGVGVTLTDVNDVVFRLAFFQREYQFLTQPQLVSEITSHYTGQALKQLYVLALGLDVLGNPYGLVVGIKKGVEDLFYEPLSGAVQGPGEFAEGLVLGVKSLFGHTVGGAAGAVSKITGAMGKGLAALTFDEEYQKKRRRGMNNKPANFHEGLARSGKGLVMGFVDGVTGVVTKPVSGAREEGVEGFFKGLGKGAIGLVARPTAGVVDFASGSFEAVKRATESGEDAKRLRPPRFQHYDNVLRPYCYTEALGNKILKELDKGKYATTDSFIHIEEIIPKVEFLLVSNHRLIYAQRNEMFGVWTSIWAYQWSEIENINAVPRGIQFTLKREPTKRMLGLFSSGEPPNKLVLVPDERRRETLIETIKLQSQDSRFITRLPSSRYSNLNKDLH